jgi:hypothetical protein
MPKTHNDIPQLGDAPIEDEFRGKMNFLAKQLDHLFNGGLQGKDRKVGFCLMVFHYGDAGRCNYISNGADRTDIVTLMKEMIARFEGQPEMKGNA